MDANNSVMCPNFNIIIKLGSVGMANLACHRGSEKCKANKKKLSDAKTDKKLQSSMPNFFQLHTTPIPVKVALPSLI